MGVNFDMFQGEGICLKIPELTKEQKKILDTINKQWGNWEMGIYQDSYADDSVWVLFSYNYKPKWDERYPEGVINYDERSKRLKKEGSHKFNNTYASEIIPFCLVEEDVSKSDKERIVKEYLSELYNNATEHYNRYKNDNKKSNTKNKKTSNPFSSIIPTSKPSYINDKNGVYDVANPEDPILEQMNY
jgi:hypothetical protein